MAHEELHASSHDGGSDAIAKLAFVDQDVTSGSSPTLDGTNFTSLPGAPISPDPYARANHTGTQLAATISDFQTTVSANSDVTTSLTHVTSDGSDHTFLDQSVVSGATPTLTGTNFSGIPNGALSTNPLTRANHTGTQTASTISDFASTVSANSDVSTSLTHVTSSGADHSYLNQDVTTSGTPTFASLKLGITTTVNSVIDDDTMGTASATALATSESIKAYVDSVAVGLFENKGGYNANTNVPDLDTTPTGILNGDAYTVTVAGTFFTEAVEVGDVLVANQDDPVALADWIRVNKNISFGTTAGTAAEGDDSRIVASNTHTTSDGKDHSDVVLNNTHRTSAGTDHSDVGLNNTHRTSDGSDHTFIDQSVTESAVPSFNGLNIDDDDQASLSFRMDNNDVNWIAGTRNDVGGNNEDFKLLRYIAGVYQGVNLQIQNSDGKMGLGGVIPEALLHIFTSDSSIAPTADADELFLESSGNTGLTIASGATSTGRINFGDSADADVGFIEYDHSTNNLAFNTDASPGHQMELQDTGDVGIGTGSNGTLAGRLHVKDDDTSSIIVKLEAAQGSYVGSMQNNSCYAAAGTGYNFLSTTSDSDGTPDTEHVLRGDGEGLCDGSWTGGGADYAEYFESSDGTSIAPGTTVVLIEGGEIREALEGETPDGVISVNPTSVGNAAPLKWVGKYLRTDYGNYDLDEEGNRQLNPDFDPEVEYIPREQRDEWNLVGLLGQIRVTKGQPVAPQWKLMKEISENVDLYLVR